MDSFMRASFGDRRSLELQKRRSQELLRSQRRYDEHWGAAESTDTRLKCRDGVQLCVHSQMLACWSPVLRDMIHLYPSHGLVESMHGPTYVFSVDDDSATWTAVLNNIYPVLPHQELSWELLESAITLADKYAMSGVVQRLLCSVADGRRPLSLEAAQPNFVLRWLALAQRMQCHSLGAALLGWLRPLLPTLARRPHSMSAFMAYAADNLDKELLLLLLEAAMESVGSSGGGGRPSTTSRASFGDDASMLPPSGLSLCKSHLTSGATTATGLQRVGSGDTDSDREACTPGRPCSVAGCPTCSRLATALTSSLYGNAGTNGGALAYTSSLYANNNGGGGHCSGFPGAAFTGVRHHCGMNVDNSDQHAGLLLQLGLQQ